MRKRELARRLAATKLAKADLVEAIRLTQEYIQLPAVPGWSWHDALARHAPEVLAQLKNQQERLHGLAKNKAPS